MDPRNPNAQPTPPHITGNQQPAYIQTSMNKFNTNGQQQFVNQPLRQPGYQTSPRMGRNVATVGPMTGKPHQMDGLPDMPIDGAFPMPGQAMGPGMPNDPGAFQRGAPMYQHPMMVPGGGMRGPALPPQQQTMFNQMPGQMPMEMMHQQRFQSPHPPGGPRFSGMPPSVQYPNDGGHMMAPMPGPEAGQMPPMGPPSSYDGGFGTKPIPSGPSPVPSGMRMAQPQQMVPAQQQPPQFAPAPLQQQHQPSMSSPMPLPPTTLAAAQMTGQPQPTALPPPNMRTGGMEMSDAVAAQHVQRHPPPMKMPQQQQQQPMPPSMQQQQQPMTPQAPFPPPGAAAQFPMPIQGTPCALCTRDLAAPPPVPPNSKLPPPVYPPVQCEAGCREWFHLACSGLTPEAFYLLKAEGPLVEWLCNPCASRAHPNIPYIRLRH